MALGLVCAGCGKAAFYFKVKPEFGQTIRTIDCYVTKGRQSMPGEIMRCQFCDAQVAKRQLRDEFLAEFEGKDADAI